MPSFPFPFPLAFPFSSREAIVAHLGYGQFSLTMNSYSDVMPALQREVAQQMDTALR